MKRTVFNALLTAAFLVASRAALAGPGHGSLYAQAEKTILQFQKSDPSIASFFQSSAGFAVFPNAGRGGFFVGGERGRGVVYEGGKPIGTATLTELTVGPQVGGQALSEVIFFETAGVLDKFKQGPCELSLEVSAVAVSEGAASKAKYRLGVLTFTRPKAGLMLQAAVGGQKFIFRPIG